MAEIYLDNSATTRICDEALLRYREVSLEQYGNPSSLHALGFEGERVLAEARREILESLSARGSSVVFTASGSEANNLAIVGRALAKERYKGAKIITTDGEHASVNEPLLRLADMGFRIVKIPTRGGMLDTDVLEREMTPDVVLVTMMMVNNETGALYDLANVARLMHKRSPESVLHVDATQSYLKVPFTKSTLGADMITLSSHKIEGPKGVGALVVDEKIIKNHGLSPLILGGGQEGGLRSGTENVPGIAAFAEAVKIGRVSLSERQSYLAGLREYLIEKFNTLPALSDIKLTLPEIHAPHILNVTLPKIKSETMLHHLSSFGIYVSSGSACSSNSRHTSSALVAYGHTPSEADCSIRISLSHRNTREELDELISVLAEGLSRLARMRR